MRVQPVYEFCHVGKSNCVHLAGHPRRTLCGRPRGDPVAQTYDGINDIRFHQCIPCRWKAYRNSYRSEP